MCVNGWVGTELDVACVLAHTAREGAVGLWQVGTPARLPGPWGTGGHQHVTIGRCRCREGTSERSGWVFF